MAIQLSSAVRNARLNSIETTIGNAGTAVLRIFGAANPTDIGAVDPANVLVSMTLPSDWMNNAAGGIKTLASGPWTAAAGASGTAQAFRIKNNASQPGADIQGTVGMSGADMILDNTSIQSGQTINITVFTLTDGNSGAPG